jgi:hypothetical protein
LGEVLDDHHRVADLDFGVRDAAARTRETHPFGGAEHPRVEVQGLRGTLHNQAGRDPSVRLRDRVRFGCCRHRGFSSALEVPNRRVRAYQ